MKLFESILIISTTPQFTGQKGEPKSKKIIEKRSDRHLKEDIAGADTIRNSNQKRGKE